MTEDKTKYLNDEEDVKERKTEKEKELKNPFADQIRNLVCYDGYLQSIYGIFSRNTDWISGWEIAKILYNGIYLKQWPCRSSTNSAVYI